MKLTITTATGLQVIEARKFSHYVKNVRFWFAYHRSTDYVACLQVTHIASGNRVCLIESHVRMACLGDDKAAAKMQIDKLVGRAGADRVYAVLCEAEKKAEQVAS